MFHPFISLFAPTVAEGKVPAIVLINKSSQGIVTESRWILVNGQERERENECQNVVSRWVIVSRWLIVNCWAIANTKMK